MLTLHIAPGTVAVASAVLLREAGVEHRLVKVDFAAQEQRSAAYLAKNPKGRVPLLETPEGLLTETGAILEYIAPAYVPQDPRVAAGMRETMYYLASTMHVAHAHKMRGTRWADREESLADMRAKVPETMTACCAYLEGHLALAPFAQGPEMDAHSQPSAASEVTLSRAAIMARKAESFGNAAISTLSPGDQRSTANR